MTNRWGSHPANHTCVVDNFKQPRPCRTVEPGASPGATPECSRSHAVHHHGAIRWVCDVHTGPGLPHTACHHGGEHGCGWLVFLEPVHMMPAESLEGATAPTSGRTRIPGRPASTHARHRRSHLATNAFRGSCMLQSTKIQTKTGWTNSHGRGWNEEGREPRTARRLPQLGPVWHSAVGTAAPVTVLRTSP
jgi:hypothetical protein